MEDSIHKSLKRCAASVGYTGRIRGISSNALSNKRVADFLQFIVEQLGPSNYVSQSELEKYEEIKKTGVILEGAELRAALSKIEGSEERPIEMIKAEISSLQQSTSALKAQLQSLNTIQKKLSDHHASLMRERENVSHTHTHSLTSYQTGIQTAHQDNARMNGCLEDLQAAVDDVVSFHQPTQSKSDEGEGVSGGSALLCHQPTGQYTSTEDHYLTELTAYTKKQFFQGIAVMAHTPDDSQCGVVDLDDPGNILMKGNSSEQYSAHCKELARLKSLYAVVEAQRVTDLLAEQYAVAVSQRAREVVTELQQSPPLDPALLRQHIRDKQVCLAELRSQTNDLVQEQLPGLIQDMSALQVSTVLHGDYSLKLARQDYFTSKQDKVISHLLAQTARQELLSMLYEVELRRHRETHRLLSAATTQLHSWRDARQTRMQAMQTSALLPVKDARQTIDSRDQFASRMCSMLGVTVSGSAPLVTHSSLERAVQQLVQQTASLEALLSALESEQLQTVQEGETTSVLLGKQVFGGTNTGKPHLTVTEYEDECSKLECLLSTLEQNIKKLLSDYDSKKKALQGNQLIERERKLFVYFFTDPQQLNRELTELARRVDAMAVAKQTA